MKTILSRLTGVATCIMLLAAIQTAIAQAPQKMSYQAVVRTSANELVTSKQVGMRLSILQGTATGSSVYIETQTPTTNANGLVTLEIGGGTLVSGTMAGINWATGNYFIKTETDPTGGSNYTISGASQLLSVPYALFAASGNQGPVGPQGVAGPAGANGIVGPIGPQGVAGVAGPQGAVGPIGANGATGPQGVAGPAGPVGATGANGATGPQGPAGILAAGSIAGNTPYWNGTSWITNNSNIFNNGGNVGIGVTTPAAKLDIVGSIKITDGTQGVGKVLTSNASGLASWQTVGGGSGWGLAGSAGTIAGTNFIGTTDAQGFDIRTNNLLRTRITTKGQIETYNTGQSVFIGEGAGAADDLTNNQNVFIGFGAGATNTTGSLNTASGMNALFSNTTGNQNTASGKDALHANTTGSSNTATGLQALYSNTTGSNNTANGVSALIGNTSGSDNTATGLQSLASNSTGFSNTATGRDALRSNTWGYENALATQR
jgi:hypothetical protein